MKRILTFLLVLVLSLCVFTGTVYAESADSGTVTTYVTALNYNEYMSDKSNNSTSGHTHIFVFYSYDAPSQDDGGNAKDGLITAICSYCDQVLSISVPYGMTYQMTGSKNATEASDGYMKYEYDADNSTLKLTEEEKKDALLSFTVTLPAGANAHHWDSGEITTEATCASKGVKTYTCTDVGCGATKIELLDRTDHYKQGKWVFQSWVVEPTCLDPIGSAVYYCEQCDPTVSFVRDGTDENLSAHKWNKGEVTTPATEKEDGEKVYTCTVCGETKTETVHNWTILDKKAATCTEDGYIRYACTNCDEPNEEEILPASGHTWETLEDGTKYCSVCKLDEEGKPVFQADDYNVSLSALEQTIGEFSDLIGEENPLFFANVTMVSKEDEEEVSEFSEHGACPSFDIPLSSLEGIDSTTPLDEIHVYYQKADGEPYEIPDCNKMVVDDCLRIFTRDFSEFLITSSPKYSEESYMIQQKVFSGDDLQNALEKNFADVVGENVAVQYMAEVDVVNKSSGNEVSEFSSSGVIPSFKVSLDEMSMIDHTTPLDSIHVYHAHENNGKTVTEELDAASVQIVEEQDGTYSLRIETTKFSTFLITCETTTIEITGIEWNDTSKTEDVAVKLYKQADTTEVKSVTLNKDNASVTWTDLPQAEYQIVVPDGYSVSSELETTGKGTIIQDGDSIDIYYAVTWEDYDNPYSLRPEKTVKLSRSSGNTGNWTVIDTQTGDSYEWTALPTKVNAVSVIYRVEESFPDSKDEDCYAVTYSTDDISFSTTAPVGLKASNTVFIKNKLNEKDWTLTKTWKNSTRLVVTMPNSITCELLYSKDAVTWQYVPDSKNNDAPMEFTLTPSGDWTATIQHLPSEYYYRFVEISLRLGDTTYKMTPTSGILPATKDSKVTSTPNSGYVYRYLYRSLNSQQQNKTVITNTYDPTHVPYTGDSSHLLLWSVVAAVTLLTLSAGTMVYVQRHRRKSGKDAD